MRKKLKDSSYPINKKYEDEYKKKIEKIRKDGFIKAINKFGDNIGENIGNVLEQALPKTIPLVFDRSARKWINPDGYSELKKLISDKKIPINELHNFIKSYSNTLRPLAGGSFEKLICDSLNFTFESEKLKLCAETKGNHRQDLIKKLATAKHETSDVKPDIDLVIFNTKSDKTLSIISCKTTFRERLMQTISWKNYFLSSNDPDIKNIKVFVVTAWETLEDATIRKRTSVLDGVYVTNKNVQVGGNIKKFDSIYDDIKKLTKN